MNEESQISLKISDLFLFYQNIPSGKLFQEMILKDPEALSILRIFKKFENRQKYRFLFIKLVELSANFK